MKKAEIIYKTTMVFQGLLWIVFSVVSLLKAESLMFNVMAIMMIFNGVFFILFAFLFKKNLFFKIVTFAFMLVNLTLTFTDQMGLFDYVVLVLNLTTLVGLILFLVLRRTDRLSQTS